MAIAPAVRSMLLAPWWVASVDAGARSFVNNPVLRSPALNRLGPHAHRVAIAAVMAQWRHRRLLDLMERLGFGRSPWRRVLALRPGDAAGPAEEHA